MVSVQREKAWLLGSDGTQACWFNSPVDMMTLAPIKSAENPEGISITTQT